MVSRSNKTPVIYSLVFTKMAEEDLEKIFSFLHDATESEYVAKNQVKTIELAIRKLVIFPNGCPEYDNGCRIHYFKKYRIIFKVDNGAQTVAIVRIFHAHQNFTELSKES